MLTEDAPTQGLCKKCNKQSDQNTTSHSYDQCDHCGFDASRNNLYQIALKNIILGARAAPPHPFLED